MFKLTPNTLIPPIVIFLLTLSIYKTCRTTNILGNPLAIAGGKPSAEGEKADINTMKYILHSDYLKTKIFSIIGLLRWEGFPDKYLSQSLFRLGNLYEIIIRRDAYSGDHSHCYGYDTNLNCKCFSEWTAPTTITDLCNIPSTIPNMANCVHADSIESNKCVFCKPGKKLIDNACTDDPCMEGCLQCNETKCKICKEQYIKSLTSNQCVLSMGPDADVTGAIPNCKEHIIKDPQNIRCQTCNDGYVVKFDDDKVCELLCLECERMIGCRRSLEVTNAQCWECKPDYKQVIKDTNSWCHKAGFNTTLSVRTNVDDYTTAYYHDLGKFELQPNTNQLFVNSLNQNVTNTQRQSFEFYLSTDMDDMPLLFFHNMKVDQIPEKVAAFGEDESSRTLYVFGDTKICPGKAVITEQKGTDFCFDQVFKGKAYDMIVYPFYFSAPGAWNYTILNQYNATIEEYVYPGMRTSFSNMLVQIFRGFSVQPGC